MKNIFRKGVNVALALVVGLAAISSPMSPATAQALNVAGVTVTPAHIVPVSATMLAADTSPMFYIKFVGAPGTGTTATTTVAVTTTSLTFVYNGAAYTGFECPVSGALGGVIDTSNAACDTLGEVVDTINSDRGTTTSLGKFRAVIGAGLRSDASNATMLADAADSEVTTPNGEIVYWDSSVNDDNEVGLWDYNLGARAFFNDNKLPAQGAFGNRDSVLLYAAETATNAGTIGDYIAYAVRERYPEGSNGSEDVRIMYQEVGGATTVLGKMDEFINAGGLRGHNEKVFVRYYASGADTSAISMLVSGYHQFPAQ